MADIFLSYAGPDRPRAKVLVEAIKQQGWSIWWDCDVRPGENWDRVIEQQLDEARCVIVLWTKASVASDWVRNEAKEGAKRKVLIPVLLEQEVERPLAFRHLQIVNLVGWEPARSNPAFDQLLSAISLVLASPEHVGTAERAPTRPEAHDDKNQIPLPPQLPLSPDAAPKKNVRASRAVHRMARELNINLDLVTSSSQDGRFSRQDLLNHVSGTAIRDVYVSSAAQDISYARRIAEALEPVGISCWIPPQILRLGTPDALDLERLSPWKALVCILSERQTEEELPIEKHEKKHARQKNIPIVFFCLDYVAPQVAGDAVIMASRLELEPHLDNLVETVGRLLKDR